jgi:endonuclease YncB( thermonuclease family)
MGLKKQFLGLFPGSNKKDTSDTGKKPFFKKKEVFPDLDEANWENTKPFIPAVNYGKVIKCYDVDTITIVAKPYKSQPIFRFSVRLSGIDGPELRSRNENEKKAAQIARKYVLDKVFGEYINLENVSSDKYGRLLAEVWLDGVCINNWLLEKKVVVPYDGGTKDSPDDWLEYIIENNPDYIAAMRAREKLEDETVSIEDRQVLLALNYEALKILNEEKPN